MKIASLCLLVVTALLALSAQGRADDEKWWHRWRATGQSTPQPYQAGPPRTLAECDDLIRSLLAEQPDLTLDELCTRVAQKRGIVASRSMMCRTVQRLNLPRKKSRSTTANGIHRG